MIIAIIALLCRLIVAFTFLIAGLTKVAGLQQSRKTVRDFGVPQWAAGPLGTLLPFAELAIAILLFPVATLLWGSVGAIVLLLAFIAAIAVNLSLGRKPECNCFGQVHSEPIGWSTLIRNGLLLAGAGLVLWDDRRGAPISVARALASLSPLGVAMLVTVVVLLGFMTAGAWLGFHLLRQNGRLLLRVDALEAQLNSAAPAANGAVQHTGPPLGSPAPYFELPKLGGTDKVTLHTLMANKKTMALIFTDPNCGPCSELLPRIAGWEREHADTLTIALISRGKAESNEEKFSPHGFRYALLQKDREVAAKYQANGTPAAILISANGMVASEMAMGAPAIINLISTGGRVKTLQATAGGKVQGLSGQAAPQPQGLPLGSPAPVVELPDLNGKVVRASNTIQSGRSKLGTLILFWNPTCGFCEKMLADLKRWEIKRPEEAPELLLISTGSPEANRAMNLESTVLLDQNFATGRAFQVRGTPSAVLLDKEGKIASEVMVGSAAILNGLESNSPRVVFG